MAKIQYGVKSDIFKKLPQFVCDLLSWHWENATNHTSDLSKFLQGNPHGFWVFSRIPSLFVCDFGVEDDEQFIGMFRCQISTESKDRSLVDL